MHNSKRLLDVYTIIKPEIEKLKKIGNTTPSLDCRILLSYVMGLSETIYSHENINISADEITLFKKLIILQAWVIGTAKPNPSLRLFEKEAELIPTTLPEVRLMRGPPEFPLFMGASV